MKHAFAGVMVFAVAGGLSASCGGSGGNNSGSPADSGSDDGTTSNDGSGSSSGADTGSSSGSGSGSNSGSDSGSSSGSDAGSSSGVDSGSSSGADSGSSSGVDSGSSSGADSGSSSGMESGSDAAANDAAAEGGVDGTACTTDTQCGSGFCVSNFCCNSTCTGTCMACSSVLTGVANGTCADITAGTAAPSGQCGATQCGNTGTCAAGGVCAQTANGATCGPGEVCNAGGCESGCYVGGAFYVSGAANPSNACQSCQPGTSTTAWTAQANGTNCGSAAVCNAGGCVSAISVIVEPNGNGASELVSAIESATRTIYMTMYEISSAAIINALVAREQTGLLVKVVLDGSSYAKSTNTSAFSTLQAAGVGVVWSSSQFTYTHENCVMIDSKQAWIMTTDLLTGSATNNREYLAIDTDAADVAEAQAIFLADYASQSITPSGNLVVAPTNARPTLVSLIAGATKSVDIEVEEFSDTTANGIVDAVVSAAGRGVKVRIVIANMTLSSSQTTANSQAKAAGASIVMAGAVSGASTPTNLYISGKTILVDCGTGTCTLGYVGSENLSANSLGYDRELGVLFSDATQLAKIEAAVNSDFLGGTPQ